MKSPLVKQVSELLLNMPDTLSLETIDRRRAVILKIAEEAKKDPLYRKTEAQRHDFYAPLANVPYEKAVLMCWVHLLERMLGAPNAATMHGVVVLCFPVVADLLRHKGKTR